MGIAAAAAAATPPWWRHEAASAAVRRMLHPAGLLLRRPHRQAAALCQVQRLLCVMLWFHMGAVVPLPPRDVLQRRRCGLAAQSDGEQLRFRCRRCCRGRRNMQRCGADRPRVGCSRGWTQAQPAAQYQLMAAACPKQTHTAADAAAAACQPSQHPGRLPACAPAPRPPAAAAARRQCSALQAQAAPAWQGRPPADANACG
jgi:hypothetical protein